MTFIIEQFDSFLWMLLNTSSIIQVGFSHVGKDEWNKNFSVMLLSVNEQYLKSCRSRDVT